MIDLHLPEPSFTDISTRLAGIDSESSEVVEIPRLNVQEKVSIQLVFLSKTPGFIHNENFRIAAEQHQDASGFKLDGTFAGHQPTASLWENFKMKTIQYYLEKYTGLIGITSKSL